MDDILIFGSSFEECLENTIEALKLLRDHGCQLKTIKSKFFYKDVEVLGHKIGHNTLAPIDKNLKAIKDLKPPQTVKQVRKILGVLNYYRKLIPNFSKIALPLSLIHISEPTRPY